MKREHISFTMTTIILCSDDMLSKHNVREVHYTFYTIIQKHTHSLWSFFFYSFGIYVGVSCLFVANVLINMQKILTFTCIYDALSCTQIYAYIRLIKIKQRANLISIFRLPDAR